MPLVILHHLLNVFVQLANKRGFTKKKKINVGIVVKQMAMGQVSSELFGFPCQLSFRRLLHNHPSSEEGTIGQLLADVPSKLSLTPLRETLKKNYGPF
jgi:hypothetical protein